MYECNTLKEYLDVFYNQFKPALTEHRIEHMIGVSYTACALAMKYGFDIKKAQITGILHDIAKGYDDESLLKLCKDNNIEISDVEKDCPFLLHGKAGAYIAENEFGINDTEILDAIRYHVTGRPGMSDLNKIVYIADFIEPGRGDKYHFKKAREVAFDGIDNAVYIIAGFTLNYLEKSGKTIDNTSIEVYNYYKNSVENKSLLIF